MPGRMAGYWKNSAILIVVGENRQQEQIKAQAGIIA